MGKEVSSLPSKETRSCKACRECVVNAFVKQCVTSRNKFSSLSERFRLLYTILGSVNSHFLPLPPSSFRIMWKQHSAAEKHQPSSQLKHFY